MLNLSAETSARQFSLPRRWRPTTLALSAIGIAMPMLLLQGQPAALGTNNPDKAAAHEVDLDAGAGPRQIRITATDGALDRLANRLAQRLVPASAVHFNAMPNQLTGAVTLPLRTPLGPQYLNARFVVELVGPDIRLARLRLGHVPVPWPDHALRLAMRCHPQLNAAFSNTASVIDHARSEPRRVTVTLSFPRDPLAASSQAWLTLSTRGDRLYVYQRRLAQALARHSAAQPVALGPLLGELLRDSAPDLTGHTAQEELRALFGAFYAYLGYAHGAPHQLASVYSQWLTVPRSVTLGGRPDWAQHFLLSAFLAAAWGEEPARTVGLAKEIYDLHHANGYSFADLAADWSGLSFARLPGPRLVERAALGLTDGDVLAAMDGLPDDVKPVQFVKHYGWPGSRRHQAVLQEIHQRVVTVPLYQP